MISENQPRLCFSAGTLDQTLTSPEHLTTHTRVESTTFLTVRSLLPVKLYFRQKHSLLEESSEGKFRLWHCPLNQKAMRAFFFSPSSGLEKDSCPKDTGDPKDAGCPVPRPPADPSAVRVGVFTWSSRGAGSRKPAPPFTLRTPLPDTAFPSHIPVPIPHPRSHPSPPLPQGGAGRGGARRAHRCGARAGPRPSPRHHLGAGSRAGGWIHHLLSPGDRSSAGTAPRPSKARTAFFRLWKASRRGDIAARPQEPGGLFVTPG